MVRDTSGGVLPGVSVEASSPALIEKARIGVTDGAGRYRIEDLRPGTYTVTFSLPGFSSVKRDGVELSGTFTATVEVRPVKTLTRASDVAPESPSAPGKKEPAKEVVEQTPEEAPTTARSEEQPIQKTDDVAVIWRRTVERTELPTLSSVLAQATVDLKDGEPSLTLDGGHAGLFNDTVTANLGKIEKIVSEEAGRKIKIKLLTSQKKPVRKRELKEKVMGTPAVREALELFEGRIIDIIPEEKEK